MSLTTRELSFGDVDGLSFAAVDGGLRSDAMRSFRVRRLGPVLEAAHLTSAGLLPRHPWRAMSASVSELVAALSGQEGFWSGPGDSEETGFVRTERWGKRYDTRLTALLMRAKRAGQRISGLSAQVSGQLAGAMGELESNIHEHAESPETGVVAYRAEAGAFEFVVSDRGMGILASLRSSPEYAELADGGVALRAALTEGVSRYGTGTGRGFGFKPIFAGLMDLYGELRFRSGDHAVTMDGIGPGVATARISQKAPLKGFFASVRCHGRPVYGDDG